MAGASRKIEMDKKVIQAGRYDNKSTAEERDEFLVRRRSISTAPCLFPALTFVRRHPLACTPRSR